MKNSNTILTAVKELQLLGFDIATDHVKEGFKHVETLTGLAGRWQTLSQTPYILCDTGHNEAAWNYLSKQLNELDCSQLFQSVLLCIPMLYLHFEHKKSLRVDLLQGSIWHFPLTLSP